MKCMICALCARPMINNINYGELIIVSWGCDM